MINKVILMGRLTRDPDFRQTTSGIPCCRFSVAITRQFANRQTGEREADFIDCVAWRQSAEFISRYFHKGSMIIVEGSLRNDNYTDNNGVKQYRMNVQVDNVTFGESKSASQGGGGQQGGVNVTPQIIITTNNNTPVPESSSSSLKVGSSGSEVKKLQQRLKDLGYLKGSVDGDFGAATETAVKNFQANNGLEVAGKAGPAALTKVYSSSARKAATTTARTNTPRPTNTPFTSLKNGSTGDDVRRMQNRLIELGWLVGTADGSYSHATEYAVKAFQDRYSSLWVDGVAGPDTLKTLYGAGAATAKTPAASLGISLEQGDEGDAVKAMQKRLKELGFYKPSVDGDFGSTTKAAVIAFQKANDISATGVATKATLNKLYSASAKDADDLKDDEAAREEEDEEESKKEQDPEDTNDVTVGGYTTLKWGATGADVKKLQQALKNRGYYSGKIDSTFGSGVYAAVKAFQKQYGLKVDGVAGPATQILLYGSTESSVNTSTSLKKGSSGTAVRNLQYVLYELGYYDGPIDGDYGDTTEDAVRAFQINNDITPVDGVAGSKTLRIVYSGNAIGASATSGRYETLTKGDKGSEVVELQETLCKLGYLSDITGEFDDATVEAVKNCQRRNDLTASGKADQEFQQLIYLREPVPAWK